VASPFVTCWLRSFFRFLDRRIGNAKPLSLVLFPPPPPPPPPLPPRYRQECRIEPDAFSLRRHFVSLSSERSIKTFRPTFAFSFRPSLLCLLDGFPQASPIQQVAHFFIPIGVFQLYETAGRRISVFSAGCAAIAVRMATICLEVSLVVLSHPKSFP